MSETELAPAPPPRRPRSRRPASAPASPALEPVAAESIAELGPAEPSPTGPAPAPTLTVTVVVPRGWTRRVNVKLVRAVVERALQEAQWDRPASLDVHFVTDEQMREVNATRRGVDEATDVLSFPLVELKPGAGLAHEYFVLPAEAALHLGDVVVSIERVEAQAKEAGHSRERELAYLTTHGVLHILGYDHETEADRRRMREREEEILNAFGLRRESAGE